VWGNGLTDRAHCFKRSALRSSLYIVQDVIAIGIFAYLAFQIDDFLAKL
jgi:omega-6 fatty acid desaturase (delta-12 desaturase)